MMHTRERAYQDFPPWAVNAILHLYSGPYGGWEMVDEAAVKKVFDQFPDASDEAKSNLTNYAMFLNR